MRFSISKAVGRSPTAVVAATQSISEQKSPWERQQIALFSTLYAHHQNIDRPGNQIALVRHTPCAVQTRPSHGRNQACGKDQEPAVVLEFKVQMPHRRIGPRGSKLHIWAFVRTKSKQNDRAPPELRMRYSKELLSVLKLVFQVVLVRNE